MTLAPPAPRHGRWEPGPTLKVDAFSRVVRGELLLPDGGLRAAVLRDWREVRWWLRPVAAWLARRECAALRALAGQSAVPALLERGRGWLLRSHLAGQALHEARPRDPAFYAAARRLLVAVHRRGVTHDDLAKEPNWLVLDDGRPGLVDFQLSRVSGGRGPLFRLLAREDLRHLLKHKRTYAGHALTARERALLARPSCPALLIARTIKPIYNTLTRRVLGWSDREGQGPRP